MTMDATILRARWMFGLIDAQRSKARTGRWASWWRSQDGGRRELSWRSRPMPIIGLSPSLPGIGMPRPWMTRLISYCVLRGNSRICVRAFVN